MSHDADRIRRLRVERGWSLVDLARVAGVDRLTVKRAEEGGALRRSTLARIYAALGVEPTPDLDPDVQDMLRDIERGVIGEAEQGE